MIILRKEKQFARLTAVARGYRNYVDLPIREFINTKLKPVAKRKTRRQVMEGSVAAGRSVNKGVTQPLAVASDAAVNFVSRPLTTVGMPLLVLPEPITTAIGAAAIGVGKGLRKIEPVRKISDGAAEFLRNTGLYKRAQTSTRGFHNVFGLVRPAPVPV